jgi:citronellol/citronellal dehydrogenase
MTTLSHKTILITGASRGIGRAMALRFAKAGANLVIAAKTAEPHAKLKGTIYTVAREVEAAGGKALPFQVDVRFESQVEAMVSAAVAEFGGIDALVNNAGAISLTRIEATPLKRYDLMQQINARAVFLCSQTVLPHLKKAADPHILNLSPPLNLDVKWLKDHAPYTLSKYGMSLLTLAMAAEFSRYRIAVNSLWPRTAIATAAIEFAVGNRKFFNHCRKPQIMADAAYEILTTPDGTLTGRIMTDEEILLERGYTDLARYAYNDAFADSLQEDFFL